MTFLINWKCICGKLIRFKKWGARHPHEHTNNESCEKEEFGAAHLKEMHKQRFISSRDVVYSSATRRRRAYFTHSRTWKTGAIIISLLFRCENKRQTLFFGLSLSLSLWLWASAHNDSISRFPQLVHVCAGIQPKFLMHTDVLKGFSLPGGV